MRYIRFLILAFAFAAAPAFAAPMTVMLAVTSDYGSSLWTCNFENSAGTLTGRCGVGIGSDFPATGTLTDKELVVDILRIDEHLVLRGTRNVQTGYAGTWQSGRIKGNFSASIQ